METEIPISSTETQSARPDMRTRSSQTSGLRDELSHLKSDLDALMLHASTLSESELSEASARNYFAIRKYGHGIRNSIGSENTVSTVALSLQTVLLPIYCSCEQTIGFHLQSRGKILRRKTIQSRISIFPSLRNRCQLVCAYQDSG
jgi:hypothetical protein